MADLFLEHLKKHDLLALHNEAQTVGYRVRVADGYIFEFEYEGGLDRFYQPGLAVVRFPDTPAGRAEARAFLASVKTALA